MRVSYQFRRPGWQRFFAGVFVGIMIGWTFFVYHFGKIHDELMIELKKQEMTIADQKKRIETLISDQKRINEENEKKLTIQEIKIHFTNDRKLKLNELTSYELKQQALTELRFLEGKDIATVAQTRELMLKAIENKIFTIGDTNYRLIAEQVYLYTTLELVMRIEIVYD